MILHVSYNVVELPSWSKVKKISAVLSLHHTKGIFLINTNLKNSDYVEIIHSTDIPPNSFKPKP